MVKDCVLIIVVCLIDAKKKTSEQNIYDDDAKLKMGFL